MSDPHHSIGEVLSLLAVEHPDLTISKIRFLESQGLISPQRTPSGYRKFFDDDVEQLRWVLSQQRDHFLPLKEIKRRIASDSADAVDVDAVDAGAVDAGAVEVDGSQSSGVANASEPKPSLFASSQASPGEAGESATLPTVDAGADSPEASDDASSSEPPSARAGKSSGAPANSSSDAKSGHRGADARRSTAMRTGISGASAGRAAAASVEASLSLNPQELAAAAGVDVALVSELRRLGLIVALTIDAAAEPVYDHEALLITRTAAAFEAHGMPARNLRMFKVAADREAGVYEQVLGALMARGDAAAVRAELAEIVELAETLRRLMLRRQMRPYLD